MGSRALLKASIPHHLGPGSLTVVVAAQVPICCCWTRRAALNESIFELKAQIIEWSKPACDDSPGHPPTEAVRVLSTIIGGDPLEECSAKLTWAVVPARGYTVERAAGDGLARERVHVVLVLGTPCADKPSAARSFHAGRHAARPVRPGPQPPCGQVFGACQTQRPFDRPQPDRSVAMQSIVGRFKKNSKNRF